MNRFALIARVLRTFTLSYVNRLIWRRVRY